MSAGWLALWVIGAVLLVTGPATGALAAGRTPCDGPWLPGINLPSGGFGTANRPGSDYIYPDTNFVRRYAAKGFKLVRLAFLAERLVDAKNGKLVDADANAIRAIVASAEVEGLCVVLDMHDYGFAKAGLVGRDAAATQAFADAWRIIAERFRDNINVAFGLMNEPHAQSAQEWLSAANAAIAAIRGAGARQLILVPGSYWSGAHSWTRTNNASVMLNVRDPAANYAYEVHQYLDANSSGTRRSVVTGAGSSRLVDFTSWARAHKKRAFLGEFGWATGAAAQSEGRHLLQFMSENRDVWFAWAYWAGGPWWGNYMFSIEPEAGVNRPQFKVLENFLR